ncbi:MAG TPA: serine hydrolase domain-containing protein [Blastocatellia bacterium]|nr:serine hydrolase domain-containing protein [Blastocatellia bacterium]
MIHLKNLTGLLLLIVLLTVQAGAQSVAPKFPDSPAGRRIEAYFKAFNSGDENLFRDFLKNNISSKSLEIRSIEDRIQVYHRMKEEFEALEPRKVQQTGAGSITILATARGGGWLSFMFEMEPAEPFKILSLGVEDTGPPPGEAPGGRAGMSEAIVVNDAELIPAIEKFLDEQLRADEFSGAVMVAKNNRPIFQKAYGLASKEHGVPNRTDTKFNLGSINKKFTEISIYQLAEAGKLSLDDRLIKHLPDYPNKAAAEKITIHQLLDMSSGIGDFFNEKFESTPKNRIRTINDYLSLFAAEPLLFEPGTSRRYSNGGYLVLGAIIEKVSGQDYYEYVREHVYRPAGMENSDSYEADVPVPNIASGYTRASNGRADKAAPRRSNIYSRPARGSSAGGGYSTLEDMLKFTIALQENRLLSPKYTSWALGERPAPGSAPKADADNAGARRNRGALGIAGGSGGVNAALEMNLDSGYTVIVLSNYDPPSAERVARQIRNMMRPAKQ